MLKRVERGDPSEAPYVILKKTKGEFVQVGVAGGRGEYRLVTCQIRAGKVAKQPGEVAPTRSPAYPPMPSCSTKPH